MSDVDVGDDIGDPSLEKLLRLLSGWGVPALVTGAWMFLALTSDASGVGKALMGVGLAIVLALWWMIRQMMLHAALSRAISVGNARRAIELAKHQLVGRGLSAREPFLIYIALAHELRGDWVAVLDVLDKVQAGGASRLRPPWKLLAASARIGALVETGDAAGARVVLDRDLAPLAARSGIAETILGQLGEGRVRWAEGDVEGARALFDRVLGEIRASANARAIAHRYAARCATAAGDAEAAARHEAGALAAAPDTWAATGEPVET